ncbi:hypothetical protein [Streptomyces sp. NPDC059604]|uniref:hypothetical protein n=1 Tax=Streptomyces sp. NPDC059604 TaxID=3346881 RepID=UPI0036CC8811
MNLTSLALLAASGSKTPGRSADPASCEITLFTSSRDGVAAFVVALVDGDNWRWAHTVLETAGFRRTGDGNRGISLHDPDHAHEALLALGAVARLTQTKLTASSETYIGDFARDLVEYLPGQWSVRVESYSMQVWQGDLAACMWSEPLAATLEKRRVRWAAVLQRDDGAELAIIRDPHHELYHVGALRPSSLQPAGLVTPPAGVTVQPEPAAAADAIRTRLLPSYTRAVLHCQVNSLEEDLDWARQTYGQGVLPDPPPTDLVDAFARFTTTAPQVTAAVRALATPTAHEAAFLQQVEGIVSLPARSDTAAVSRADRMAWWLAEGCEGLAEVARHTISDSEPPVGETSHAPGAPALPPASARSTGPRR